MVRHSDASVYRDLLGVTNGLNVNGLYLFAASEYSVVEDGVERWMPGIAVENEGYLYGIADAESRRFFGSVFCYLDESR